MTIDERTLREDIENRLEWRVEQLADECVVHFDYTPSPHVGLNKDAYLPNLKLTYKDLDEFERNKEKAVTSATNMFCLFLVQKDGIVGFKHSKAGLFNFSKIEYKFDENDRRSFFRVGRLEFWADPKASVKAGVLFDTESRKNPIFAFCVANRNPKMFALTVKGSK